VKRAGVFARLLGQIRAARPEVRILAVTQRGTGAIASPAREMTLGPGDLLLLPGPAAAVQAAAGWPSASKGPGGP
jgi:uncharacterized protein with PhoU and TrkA domain